MSGTTSEKKDTIFAPASNMVSVNYEDIPPTAVELYQEPYQPNPDRGTGTYTRMAEVLGRSSKLNGMEHGE